jgi:hypothetical protein
MYALMISIGMQAIWCGCEKKENLPKMPHEQLNRYQSFSVQKK